MIKTLPCALVALSVMSACNRNKPETDVTNTPSETEQRAAEADAAARSQDESANRDLNPEGAAAADASLVQKGLAKLDPADAEATFLAAPKVKLKGEARFNQRDDGVHVDVELSEGPPGTHGLHIHQKADCSDIPGKSMGEHFAPDNHPHGLPSAPAHHLGDLGNIEIASNGTADFEIVVPKANLQKDNARSFLNRALVIHEKRDTGSGKSGESGSPIGCAAIIAD
jgi:Cu-Zn family superoxide dismutase